MAESERMGPAIVFGTLRIRPATLRLCNLVAQSSKTCGRRRPENDSPQSRSLAAGPLVVRKSAPADPASRWLAVSILRHDVEPGGAPQGIPQPLGGRLRGELDHALRSMPRQIASPLRPQTGCMIVLSPAGPRWNSIRSRMFHRWGPCWTAWPRGCPSTMCIVYRVSHERPSRQ